MKVYGKCISKLSVDHIQEFDFYKFKSSSSYRSWLREIKKSYRITDNYSFIHNLHIYEFPVSTKDFIAFFGVDENGPYLTISTLFYAV